jgi:hypothetical protein
MIKNSLNLYEECRHNIPMIECFECLMDHATLGLNGKEEYLAVKEIMKDGNGIKK